MNNLYLAYDSYEYVKMIDPGFIAAKKVTEVTGAMLIRASCSHFFPVDPAPMATYIDSLDEKLPEVGSEVTSAQQNLIKKASSSLKTQERSSEKIFYFIQNKFT